jgi:hypothetical protein
MTIDRYHFLDLVASLEQEQLNVTVKTPKGREGFPRYSRNDIDIFAGTGSTALLTSGQPSK